VNAKFWAWKILDFFEKQTPAYSWELRCRLAYPYMLICLSPLNICTRSVWMQRMPSDALHYNTCNAETCYLKHLGYRLKRYIRSRDLSNLVASILGLNDFGLISRQLCWIQPRWPYFVRFRWWHRLLLAVLADMLTNLTLPTPVDLPSTQVLLVWPWQCRNPRIVVGVCLITHKSHASITCKVISWKS